MKTVTLLIEWDGSNFKQILSAVFKKNTEIRIRRSGKKLIFKDTNVDYYCVVSYEDLIIIPVYEGCIEEDIIEEPKKETINYNEELSNKLLKDWGLL